MRGRALGFVLLLCVTWTTGRIVFHVFDRQPNSRQPNNRPHKLPFVEGAPLPSEASPASNLPDNGRPITLVSGSAADRRYASGPSRLRLEKRARLVDMPSDDRGLAADWGKLDRIYVMPARPPAKTFTETSPAVALMQSALPVTRPPTAKLFDIYAFSFWRSGDAPLGQLGNGQYGGSQSAIIVTVPLLRHRNRQDIAHIAMIGRLATSHGKTPETEWAAGLRWQPAAAIPAQMSVERRFRPHRTDAIAAYVSGGFEGELPMGLRFDSYGQAGVVTGKDGGIFADGQMTAHRQVIALDRAALKVGGGIWAGGQDDVRRLDLGPFVRTTLPLGPARLRVDASWRFRIAGNVEPASGPAIALSTSF